MTAKKTALTASLALALIALVHTPAIAQTELAMLVTARDEITDVSLVGPVNWAVPPQPAAAVRIDLTDAVHHQWIVAVSLTPGRETSALNALENNLNYPVDGTPTLSEFLLDPLPPSFRVFFGLFMPGSK